ncbi:MAG: hypothetical protein K6E52_05700 [Bacteroidaceae bacterium]|nr:hypothetical protein [Bacteroidaceae bacterium]
MEQLKELKIQVASLRQYAKDVEPVMAAVMMLMDHQTKKEVLDYLDAVVIKLNEVADMIDHLPTKDVQPDQSAPSEICVQTSKDDLSHWMAEIQLHHRQLGEVLDDMVSRQDELTAEDFVWMMDYIAQTRCTLNCLLNDGKHTLNLPPNYFFNEKEG